MDPPVPATTAIRRSRARNIDTDRLQRRRAHLVDELTNRASAFPTRIRFALRAAELLAIEEALIERGALDAAERATVPAVTRRPEPREPMQAPRSWRP